MQVFSEEMIDKGLLPEGVRLVRLDAAGQAEIEAAVCCRATAKKIAAMDMPNLRLVQLTSAGFDGVPLDEFSRKGIRVANAAGVYGVPIAETVVFGMLQMAKRFVATPIIVGPGMPGAMPGSANCRGRRC
jgi:lactate dehydrogenase-like 2-hydroxyacid dehydrogenase